MKIHHILLLIISCIFISCNNTKSKSKEEAPTPAPTFQNKGHQLVHTMVQKVGDYSKLASKKDVSYTYTYLTPDNKKDVSKEKYIFDGELSYGKYETHERTLSQLEGTIEQGYDGNTYWLKHNNQLITDEDLLKKVAFNRPTNFYWFAMMQKLLDPGLIYSYIGEQKINDQLYDVVKVTFETQDNKPKDIYQLYINRQTSLVDQFLFTVADFGVMETPLLMQLSYEEVDGILIPTQRQYKKSTWEADVTDAPWIKVIWSDIQFDKGLSKEIFKP